MDRRVLGRLGLTPLVVAVFFGLLVLWLTGPAFALDAVSDAATHAILRKTQSVETKQLTNIEKALNTAKDLNRAIGKQGRLITDAGSIAGSIGRETARLNALGKDFEGWGLRDEEIKEALSALRSFGDAKAFVIRHLVTVKSEEGGYSIRGVNKTMKRRQRATQEAATAGYAIALSERQAAVASASDLSALAGRAAAATTLREDVATTNQILLIVGQELIAQRVLLSQMLELMAGEALERSRPGDVEISEQPESASADAPPPNPFE